MEETEKIAKMLETLTSNIEELTKTIKDESVVTKENIEETTKEEKTLEKLTRQIEDLTNVIKEKKLITEEKIKENPLAYLIGAFTGGLFIGFILGKGKGGNKEGTE